VIKGQNSKFIEQVILNSASYKRSILKALFQFHFDIPGLEADADTNMMIIHENLLEFRIRERLKLFLKHFRIKWLGQNSSMWNIRHVCSFALIALITGQFFS